MYNVTNLSKSKKGKYQVERKFVHIFELYVDFRAVTVSRYDMLTRFHCLKTVIRRCKGVL